MNYTVNLFLGFEERPDEPYFTKEIFLAMCMDDVARLAATKRILAGELLDNETREVIYKTIDVILKEQKAIIYGVLSGQITFSNKTRREELNESIRE